MKKNCNHEHIEGTETYGVRGSYDKEDKKIYLKQGDGGLNNDLKCLDCGEHFSSSDRKIEFV